MDDWKDDLKCMAVFFIIAVSSVCLLATFGVVAPPVFESITSALGSAFNNVGSAICVTIAMLSVVFIISAIIIAKIKEKGGKDDGKNSRK